MTTISVSTFSVSTFFQLRMQRFQITVETGKCECAGTDANVFINILGKDGETGQQKLSKRNSQVKPYNKPSLSQVDSLMNV